MQYAHGGYGVTVNTTGCGSVDSGSIPGSRPNNFLTTKGERSSRADRSGMLNTFVFRYSLLYKQQTSVLEILKRLLTKYTNGCIIQTRFSSPPCSAKETSCLRLTFNVMLNNFYYQAS
jgi:hypothetical protein